MGKAVHLEDSLRAGAFRLTPATSYKNVRNNAAIYDDEMTFTIHAKFQHYRTKQELGEITQTHAERTDYLMLCLCNKFDLRLPFDFDSDALLVIRDKKEFLNRVSRALTEQIGERFGVVASDIVYADPYLQTDEFESLVRKDGSLRVWRAKHFRYMYQKEFRIAALPKTPVKKFNDAIDFKIGDISDISEIHAIDK